MKSGASSLNPYAASYVPLSKRGAAADNTQDFNKSKVLNNGIDNVWYGNQLDHTSIKGSAEMTKSKDHEFYASPSDPNGVTDTSNYNQEFMDLAYLQMSFPGVSEDSLSDVYFANRCDIEASMDMLDQLEIYPENVSDKLPDTLDIGDVPDSSGHPGELPSQGQWNLALSAKAEASTPGSSILSPNS